MTENRKYLGWADRRLHCSRTAMPDYVADKDHRRLALTGPLRAKSIAFAYGGYGHMSEINRCLYELEASISQFRPRRGW